MSPNMPSESVSLIDSAGNVSVVTIALQDYDGGDRMVHVQGALWVRTGKDGSNRKQFTYLRSQRP